MLYELVYSSFASTAEADEATLDDILRASRRRNAGLGITGVLIYLKGEYVQLLEGERDAVRSLYYDVLRYDKRHLRPYVAWEHEIAARTFANWQMGFARPAAQAGLPGPAVDGYVADSLSALDLTTPASTGQRLLLAIHADIARNG